MAGGSDVPSDAICPGARFATYVLHELVGFGALSSIYRARDARLLREVAIKIWTSGAPAGADGLARFLHEARMAAAIQHPNVVGIFDVGVHDGAPYIVMELLGGEDLDVRLRSARALTEAAVIDMALPLVAGLAAVHDAGVVHRDLKPSNIFLARGPNGEVRPTLLDFGVSKHLRDSSRLTTLGRQRWAAMPLYTAPEVLLGGEATFSSDQYALGVLLYECVTGVNPFRSDSVRDSIELITSGQYLPASAQGQRASRGLAKVIERAMSPDPEARFADVRELGRALVAVAGRRARATWGSTFAAAMVASGASELGPKRRPPARRRGLGAWAFGAAVAGWSIAGVLSAWFLTGAPRGPAPPVVAVPALSPAPAVPQVGATAPPPDPGARVAPELEPAAGQRVALMQHELVPDAPGSLPSSRGLPVSIGAGREGELVVGEPGGAASGAPGAASGEPGAATSGGPGAAASGGPGDVALAAQRGGSDGAPALGSDEGGPESGPEPAVELAEAPADLAAELGAELGPEALPDGSLAAPDEQAPEAAEATPEDRERGTNGALIFD